MEAVARMALHQLGNMLETGCGYVFRGMAGNSGLGWSRELRLGVTPAGAMSTLLAASVAARCGDELAAAGAMPRRDCLAGRAALTPGDLRSGLGVGGATNEIALRQALVISAVRLVLAAR